jgi:hypothetical protein
MFAQVQIEHCVSAATVVRWVAAQVPVPEHFGFTEPEERRARLDFQLRWTGLLSKAAQEAEASAQLDALLLNAGDLAPKWFDWGGRTQLPRVSQDAASDGHRILTSRTDFRNRVFELAAGAQSWTSPVMPPIRDEQQGDSQRLESIGFIRDQIVAFLEKIGVPFSLNPPGRTRAEWSSAAVVTAWQAPELPDSAKRSGETAADSAPRNVEVRPESWISEETIASDARIGRRHDPVAAKIRAAVLMARQEHLTLANTSRDDPALVNRSWEIFSGWAKLVTQPFDPLAAESKTHAPLSGYDFGGRTVAFDPAIGKAPMDLDAFRKRVSPKAGGRAQQKAKLLPTAPVTADKLQRD